MEQIDCLLDLTSELYQTKSDVEVIFYDRLNLPRLYRNWPSAKRDVMNLICDRTLVKMEMIPIPRKKPKKKKVYKKN